MGEKREPTKKSSIEKKKRIMEKGFELMCNKGYHNVNCANIATYAGVSTGIIYQYFDDKKDIFLEGMKDYSNKFIYPTLYDLSMQKITKDNIETVMSDLIDKLIKLHQISKSAHEELVELSHHDIDIKNYMLQSEMMIINKISEIFINNDINIPNIREKVHIGKVLLSDFCHEMAYEKHEEINYEIIKQEIIKIINILINE